MQSSAMYVDNAVYFINVWKTFGCMSKNKFKTEI